MLTFLSIQQLLCQAAHFNGSWGEKTPERLLLKIIFISLTNEVLSSNRPPMAAASHLVGKQAAFLIFHHRQPPSAAFLLHEAPD